MAFALGNVSRISLAALVLVALAACDEGGDAGPGGGGGNGGTLPPPPPPPPPTAIAITSSAPPVGIVGSRYGAHEVCSYRCGTVYYFKLSASGGDGNFTWDWVAANGSSLPPGLSLTDGAISGTPTVGSVGSYNVIITVTDGGTPPGMASSAYTITISNPPPPVIEALPGPPGATLDQPYSYQFAITGLAPITISETGALPPGLAPLSATGLLAGTPNSANLYPITVQAIDAAGQASSQVFTIGVFQHGFAPTGGMQAMHFSHAATLLASGQVLVTGGVLSEGGNVWSDSAELYTPTSGSFATTGALQVARASHTATLLCDLAAPPCSNPQVLVVGGNSAAGAVGSAELYDPATAAFALTAGNLATARFNHTATLLPSGKVLIAGGKGSDPSPPLASAELFDPATGTFSATAAPMASARFSHTATLLTDGKVLIVGGYGAGGALDSAELYDPATNTFSTIPSPMTVARYGHTATLLPGGKVLIAGGANADGAAIAAAEIYDPAAVAPDATFISTGALAASRTSHAAVLLPSGQVLVAGGICAQGPILPHAELYDPASGSFTPTGGMHVGRVGHTLTALGESGQVLVAGGDDGNSDPAALDTAELYR